MTHGGKRPGAGRPPAEDKRVVRAIKMSSAEWQRVKDLAGAEGLKVSEYIRRKALGMG